MMEKRNVVASDRTPEHELKGADEDWDKRAADIFSPAETIVKPLEKDENVEETNNG